MTTKKLEALTPEQEARIPEWRDKWIAIGHSTEPADWESAERGIRMQYESAEIQPPDLFIRLPSPICIPVALTALRKTPKAERARLGITRDMPIEAKLSSDWNSYLGGNLWCSHSAWYTFFTDVCGLDPWSNDKERKAAEGLRLVSTSCGWWWPGREWCLIVDRPQGLHVEKTSNGARLHCEDGPSMVWRDGCSVWHIHGVEVDEQIVMAPDTQTLAQIDGDTNQDRRRIRIERYGWLKYVSASKAEIVEFRDNDIDGTSECLMRLGDGRMVLVAACCSTGREYALPVPREIKTCADAQRWLSGGLSDRTIGAA